MVNNAQNLDNLNDELLKNVQYNGQYLVGTRTYYISMTSPSGTESVMVCVDYFVIVGATKIRIRSYEYYYYPARPSINGATRSEFIYPDIPLPFDAVYQYENDPQYYYNFILKNITVENINPNINAVAEALKNNSLATMKYAINVDGFNWIIYNFPWEIKIMVEGRLEGSEKIFIPFYTRKIISDSYPTPDCGFTFEIASDMNDAIRWMAVNKGLIIGTETAEWIVPSGVHATNQQAVLNSRYGSDRIQGTAIGDATVFFQTGKKSLVEYYIPQADNNFRANNMAMLSAQMLNESPAVEFDFTSSPYTKLFITREDGTMAALLYERGTGTFAWGRITLGAGKIRSAAVLPGPDGNDDVYLLTVRASGWHLEKLRETGAVYLDGYSPVVKDNWAALKAAYSAGGLEPKACRIYKHVKKVADVDRVILIEETRYTTYGAGKEPDWTKDGEFYIGYPYASVLRTMPVITNDRMKKQRIVELVFRFLDSYFPKMTSIISGGRNKTDTLTQHDPPYSGIYKQAFPGSWDEEVQAELTADEAAPVKILALNAEMAGA
jgi:hypothetical protein